MNESESNFFLLSPPYLTIHQKKCIVLCKEVGVTQTIEESFVKLLEGKNLTLQEKAVLLKHAGLPYDKDILPKGDLADVMERRIARMAVMKL